MIPKLKKRYKRKLKNTMRNEIEAASLPTKIISVLYGFTAKFH
jgi:hypothetical protein